MRTIRTIRLLTLTLSSLVSSREDETDPIWAIWVRLIDLLMLHVYSVTCKDALPRNVLFLRLIPGGSTVNNKLTNRAVSVSGKHDDTLDSSHKPIPRIG